MKPSVRKLWKRANRLLVCEQLAGQSDECPVVKGEEGWDMWPVIGHEGLASAALCGLRCEDLP